ncbi:DUF4232 domain-containing protein [Embleya sp. NPDC020630]|uniref:DUF4232 domain-containing protein n=1 Tax=Embleya sp. NPDC020630 TaxID=3363979 RepID=UPI0037944A5E
MITAWRAWSYGLLVSAVVVGMSGCGDTSGSTTHAGKGGSMSVPTAQESTGPSSAPTKPTTPAPPADCPESGVRLTAEEPDAAMGLRAMTLTMANCGNAPRTVTGYPSLRVLDAHRAGLSVEIDPGAASITTMESLQAKPRSVTLHPGEQAVSVVVWRNTVTAGSSQNALYLDVEPLPGQARQQIPVPGGIDLGTTARLGIGPWHTPT